MIMMVSSQLKPQVFLSCCLFLVTLVLPAHAQRSETSNTLPLSSAPYRVGERLTFNVSFSNFTSAAHVELEVAAKGTFFGRDAVQLRARVETTGLVNAALYAINNNYITYVTPDTGLPFRRQQILREASGTSDVSSEVNQPAGISAMPSKIRSGQSPGTYDFLSVLYRLRALPLTQGDVYYFNVLDGSDRGYQAELKIRGHESIKTNVGTFNAIVSEVKVANDSRADDFRIRIYFSDDERHVPVLITARHKAGEIRAELAASVFVTPPSTSEPPNREVGTTPPASSSTPAPALGNGVLNGLPFHVGEQLNYQVFLGSASQPAAVATFQVQSHATYFNRNGLLLTANAQTTNALQRIFFASDQFSSYVDIKTLLPFRTEMNLVEGRRRLNQKLSIDQERGTVSTDRGDRLEIPVGTHDYVSLFYSLRSLDLSPSSRNALSLLVDNKPKTIIITALKRETIQLGTQKIPAIQISLTTDDPVSDKFSLRAWISDDSRSLPLRLTATTELGILRADLAIVPLAQQ